MVSMSDSQSSSSGLSPALTTSWICLLVSPEFRSSATDSDSDFYYYALFTKYNKINIYRIYMEYKRKRLNKQLVCLWSVGILNNVMFNLKYLFQLFA